MTPISRFNGIVAHVSELTGIGAKDILSKTRRANVVRARMLAAWTARHGLELSLPRIGALLHRDHTTVLHAVRRIDRERSESAETAQICRSLLAEFGKIERSAAA